MNIPGLCIQLHGVEKSCLVIDSFLGIGNTALACLGLGVAFVGFEIDASYLSEARRAIQRARTT